MAQVESLIKNGANINSKDNNYGWTPIHTAAHAGHEKIVEVLINNGAQVDARNYLGGTPLVCK